MADTKIIGQRGEALARQYLIQLGWDLIKTNYRLPYGEIDILAKDGDDIIIVEVKAKSNLRFGLPQEEVNQKKQFKLRKLAYRVGQDYPNRILRIDVLAIDYSQKPPKIEHIINAVEA